MANTQCRHFNGYKPCGWNDVCDSKCAAFAPVGARILFVHLEAMGAVLRSTSLLAAIRRKYPRAHITWVTKAPSDQFLRGHSTIDRVLTVSSEDLLKLASLEFDAAMVVDKSLAAVGVTRIAKVHQVFGFTVGDSHGEILPANPEAKELWELGLSNHLKFFVNQKTEQQLVHESLCLGAFQRDEYSLELSSEEFKEARIRRERWLAGAPSGARAQNLILGINTGCSPTLPNKKLSISGHRLLIERILKTPMLKGLPIVLLGGPEDSERNRQIAQDLPVIPSPTEKGLRDGLVSVEAVDLIVSGDSLGMHMAIGLKKWVVAWFGPSCAQEIDLYERGRKILTSAGCSPCWKRVCDQSKMCYDQVDFAQVVSALNEGVQWHILSSKPHSPETFFSPSP